MIQYAPIKNLFRYCHWISCFFLFSSNSFYGAQPLVEVSQEPSPLISNLWKSNQMAVIDWNPVSLINSQLSLSGEYLVVDGFGFGAQLNYQKIQNDNWMQDSFSVGASLVQYFQSSTVNGWYAKGSASLFLKKHEFEVSSNPSQTDFGFLTFQDDSEWKSETVIGMAFGAQSGYRFVFSERFSGAVFLGLEREVPGFFSTHHNSMSETYIKNNKMWIPQVGATLGLVF